METNSDFRRIGGTEISYLKKNSLGYTKNLAKVLDNNKTWWDDFQLTPQRHGKKILD